MHQLSTNFLNCTSNSHGTSISLVTSCQLKHIRMLPFTQNKLHTSRKNKFKGPTSKGKIIISKSMGITIMIKILIHVILKNWRQFTLKIGDKKMIRVSVINEIYVTVRDIVDLTNGSQFLSPIGTKP